MDKKKKNINQPKNNTYWMYGLIISIFIIFSYIGNAIILVQQNRLIYQHLKNI